MPTDPVQPIHFDMLNDVQYTVPMYASRRRMPETSMSLGLSQGWGKEGISGGREIAHDGTPELRCHA